MFKIVSVGTKLKEESNSKDFKSPNIPQMLLFLLKPLWKTFLEPLTSGSIYAKKKMLIECSLLLDAILEAKNKEEMSSDSSD